MSSAEMARAKNTFGWKDKKGDAEVHGVTFGPRKKNSEDKSPSAHRMWA